MYRYELNNINLDDIFLHDIIFKYINLNDIILNDIQSIKILYNFTHDNIYNSISLSLTIIGENLSPSTPNPISINFSLT